MTFLNRFQMVPKQASTTKCWRTSDATWLRVIAAVILPIRRIANSLSDAGIKREDIDAVVISHGHIDHIGGIVDDSGALMYPNAQVYMSQADFDYWTDERQMDSPWKKAFIVHARKNLLPVRDRLIFFKDEQEFLPGITAIAAPGHTLGHTMFNLQSNGQSFVFVSDLSHHSVLLIENPRMECLYSRLVAYGFIRLSEEA